jgi:hypothetical protein
MWSVGGGTLLRRFSCESECGLFAGMISGGSTFVDVEVESLRDLGHCAIPEIRSGD